MLTHAYITNILKINFNTVNSMTLNFEFYINITKCCWCLSSEFIDIPNNSIFITLLRCIRIHFFQGHKHFMWVNCHWLGGIVCFINTHKAISQLKHIVSQWNDDKLCILRSLLQHKIYINYFEVGLILGLLFNKFSRRCATIFFFFRRFGGQSFMTT